MTIVHDQYDDSVLDSSLMSNDPFSLLNRWPLWGYFLSHFVPWHYEIVLSPVKTDFMFYISSHVRLSHNSGKNCTNFYFAIFFAAFQFSKFLMNMLSTFVSFYSFPNHYLWVYVALEAWQTAGMEIIDCLLVRDK